MNSCCATHAAPYSAVCKVYPSVWIGNCRGLTRYRDNDGVQQWRDDNQIQAQLKLSIENVLRLIYVEHYEVPFIATQRKQVSHVYTLRWTLTDFMLDTEVMLIQLGCSVQATDTRRLPLP